MNFGKHAVQCIKVKKVLLISEFLQHDESYTQQLTTDPMKRAAAIKTELGLIASAETIIKVTRPMSHLHKAADKISSIESIVLRYTDMVMPTKHFPYHCEVTSE